MIQTFAISPSGSLYWEEVDEDQPLIVELQKRWDGASAVASILLLAREESAGDLPPAFGYWQDFGRLYLSRLCHTAAATVEPPTEIELTALVQEIPPMKGSEFLRAPHLVELWKALDQEVQEAIQKYGGDRAEYFKGTRWHLVGRVTFHLAENKRDENRPFAFLATYTSGVSGEAGKAQHIPLGKAVQQYAGEGNKATLLKLLEPVDQASQKSALIKELVDSGRIYQPQGWSVTNAYRFLKEVPILEQSGVLVRVPNWWKGSTHSRAQVSITVGGKKTSLVGQDALLDFNVNLTLDGETISPEEWKEIAASSEGLTFLRGRWVEINKNKLEEVLEHWKGLQKEAKGIDFLQALRLLAGTPLDKSDSRFHAESDSEWTRIQAGDWLTQVLDEMRHPETLATLDAVPGLNAQLRPLSEKGNGVALADVSPGAGSLSGR